MYDRSAMKLIAIFFASVTLCSQTLIVNGSPVNDYLASAIQAISDNRIEAEVEKLALLIAEEEVARKQETNAIIENEYGVQMPPSAETQGCGSFRLALPTGQLSIHCGSPASCTTVTVTGRNINKSSVICNSKGE